VVERIVASIFDANGDASNAILDNDLLLGTRQVFTPQSWQVLLIGNRLQALRAPQVIDEPNTSLAPADSPPSNVLWTAVVGEFGVLRPGISYIRLEQPDGTDVIGTVAFDPTDDRFLLFTVDADTIPANTLASITAVIDPLRSGPGAGLAAPAVGQRYLLTQATGSQQDGSAESWLGTGDQPLVAQANDIVAWAGARWQISFDATSSDNNTQFVTNETTEIQYRWTGATWIKSYQGLYTGGTWSLVL